MFNSKTVLRPPRPDEYFSPATLLWKGKVGLKIEKSRGFHIFLPSCFNFSLSMSQTAALKSISVEKGLVAFLSGR